MTAMEEVSEEFRAPVAKPGVLYNHKCDICSITQQQTELFLCVLHWSVQLHSSRHSCSSVSSTGQFNYTAADTAAPLCPPLVSSIAQQQTQLFLCVLHWSVQLHSSIHSCSSVSSTGQFNYTAAYTAVLLCPPLVSSTAQQQTQLFLCVLHWSVQLHSSRHSCSSVSSTGQFNYTVADTAVSVSSTGQFNDTAADTAVPLCPALVRRLAGCFYQCEESTTFLPIKLTHN